MIIWTFAGPKTTRLRHLHSQFKTPIAHRGNIFAPRAMMKDQRTFGPSGSSQAKPATDHRARDVSANPSGSLRASILPDRRPHAGSLMSKASWRSINPKDALRAKWHGADAAAVHGARDFTPGTIIRAHIYEEAWKDTPPEESALIHLPGRDPLIGKKRLMIVVAQYTANYVSVPLFTHNGLGLARKTNPEEFVSVCDHRVSSADDFIEQSGHAPLVTEHTTNPNSTLHPLVTARICYPVSRDFVLTVVIEGRLSPESTTRLIKLYNTFSPAVQADIEEHTRGPRAPSNARNRTLGTIKDLNIEDTDRLPASRMGSFTLAR